MKSHSPHCYWITGLPAAGKTTLAYALSTTLQGQGKLTYVLDDDKLGLPKGSGQEKTPHVGEVARLMTKAGITVVCAFVSPFKDDRQHVRALFATGQFIEIHLSTPVAECARRDPKGLYALAQAGHLSGLTGWDAPYEVPLAPDFRFDATTMPVSDMVRMLSLKRRSESA